MSEEHPESAPEPTRVDDVHERARRLLDKALSDCKITSIADVLQKNPDAGPQQIRDQVLASLLHGLTGASKIKTAERASLDEANALLCCAMDLLDMQLCGDGSGGKVEPGRILVIQTPSGPPPLPDQIGQLLSATETLDTVLMQQSWVSASLTERVGLLIALLVTRSGLCHPALIRSVLSSLQRDEPIRITPGHLWIITAVEIDKMVQMRRVFLDPATLAAMSLVRSSLKDQNASSNGLGHDVDPQRLIREGWQALRRRLKQDCALPSRVDQLMAAVATRIQLDSVPLLASYARGSVASTSWQESCWLRMLGYDSAEPVLASGRADTRDGQGDNPQSALSIVDRAISEPVDEDSFLKSLREATQSTGSGNRTNDRALAVNKLCELMAAQTPGCTKHLVAGWVLYLLVDARQGKGRRLALSTVNQFRATLASRLIGFLPERLNALTGEDLTDLLAEMVDSIHSPPLKRRVSELLKRFNAYCIKQGLRIEGAYELPKTSAAEADISARHVSLADYRRALDHLRHPEDDPSTLEARVFLMLAFRFGARRAEILGLTLLDVKKGNALCDLQILPNDARALKTGNALRRLPLALLDEDEQKALQKLWIHRDRATNNKIDRRSQHRATAHHQKPQRLQQLTTTYLFLASNQAPAAQIPDHPAASQAIEALRIVTGDPHLHLHHLRHAFASRNVLGSLLRDLPSGADDCLPPVLEEMRDPAEHFHKHVHARVGQLARRGSMVSMALGHGSDKVSYQHYVHGLDLLVYATRSATRHKARRQSSTVLDLEPALRQHEAAEAALILGKSPHTKPPTRSIPTWIAKKASAAGLKVQVLGSARHRSRPPLDVHWAKAHPELREQSGHPESEVQFARVSATLRLLSQGMKPTPHQVALIVKLLADGLRPDGWSELQCADAARLRKASETTLGPDRFEYRHATYKGRVRKMVTLKGHALSRWLKNGGRSIQVRIRDPAAGKDPQRQRHSRVIGWAVKAAAVYVREFMPELLGSDTPSDAPSDAPSAPLPFDD